MFIIGLLHFPMPISDFLLSGTPTPLIYLCLNCIYLGFCWTKSKRLCLASLRRIIIKIWFIHFCQSLNSAALHLPVAMPNRDSSKTCYPPKPPQKTVRNVWKCNKMAHTRTQTAHSRSGQESTKAERGWKWWRGGKRRRRSGRRRRRRKQVMKKKGCSNVSRSGLMRAEL